MRLIRIFVSSPRDVSSERQLVSDIAQRMNADLGTLARFETFLWEERVYEAHDTFQNLIEDAGGCEIVIGILRHRMGTPMPPWFRRMPAEAPFDGDPYPSGTAYEILSAIEARKEKGSPAIFVFRLSQEVQPPTARIDQESAVKDARAQWAALQNFVGRILRAPTGEYLKAYYEYEGPDELQELVSKALRQWLQENLPGSPDVIWPIAQKGSPFRSLEPFDARHASIFFGRDTKVGNAIQLLIDASRQPKKIPFMMILGPSGAGKSSLMRAGVASRLTTPGRVGEVREWRTAMVRVGEEDAFLALAKALLVSGEEDDPGGYGCALPELAHFGYGRAEDLASLLASVDPAPAPIWKVLNDLSERASGRWGAGPGRTCLLLLIDQFESIFATEITSERQVAFGRLLLALCRTGFVWVVATLRADQYERMLTPGPFIELDDKGVQYKLASPGESELSEIITKSAAAAGLSYEYDPESREGLDERLLKDAAGSNTLPLLQFALEQLYRGDIKERGGTKLTFKSYRELRGLNGAIDRTAESALEQLREKDPTAADALPRLLRQLVVHISAAAPGSAGSALTIRPARREAVSQEPGSKLLIATLTDARILVTWTEDSARADPSAPPLAYVSIAHQRVLESWAYARGLLDLHAEYFRVKGDVELGAARWIAQKQDRDYLILSPPLLAAAEKQIAAYPAEFAPDLLEFIKMSSQRARRELQVSRRQTAQARIVAVVALAASVATFYFFWRSQSSLDTAQRNLNAARVTIDELVKGVADQLANEVGFRLNTVKASIKIFDDALDNLSQRAGDEASLRRTRGTMLYRFAKVYQKSAEQQQAQQDAQASFEIRQHLLGLQNVDLKAANYLGYDPALWKDFADSLDLRGDIIRDIDPQQAVEPYEAARTIRSHFVSSAANDSGWTIDLSMSYVRLGDVADKRTQKKDPDIRKKGLMEARRNYLAGLVVIGPLYLFRQEPEIRREFSWDLDKLGTVAKEMDGGAAAALFYSDAVCLRRISKMEHPNNEVAIRDLAFSLERLAQARMTAPSADVHDILVEEEMLRRDLVAADKDNPTYALEMVTSVVLFGHYFRQNQQMQKARDAFDLGQKRLEDAVHRFESLAEPTNKSVIRLRNDLDTARKSFDQALAAAAPSFGERGFDIDAEVTSYRTALGRSPDDSHACEAATVAHIRDVLGHEMETKLP